MFSALAKANALAYKVESPVIAVNIFFSKLVEPGAATVSLAVPKTLAYAVLYSTALALWSLVKHYVLAAPAVPDGKIGSSVWKSQHLPSDFKTE
jgi:hypothetical protein